jgi:sulfoxide reductase heme-binding subunit YedZ
MAGQFTPWRDHAGRISPLKLATFVILLLPGLWLLLRILGHDLGGRPITELTHSTGDWTVRFLLATLAVTPLRAVLDWPRLVLLRRMLGVGTACYAAIHVMLYVVDQKFALGVVVSEIARRFYLTIGFLAFLGLLTLAITSTDGWQKRLRQRWKKLHRLVFVIAGLGLLHYFIQTKLDVTAAVFAAGIFAWLGLWRLAPKRWQGRLALVAGLAVLAPLATALTEGTWYALATGVRASRVLAANLDLGADRPSAEILLWAAVLLAVAILRRWRRWPIWRRRPQPA